MTSLIETLKARLQLQSNNLSWDEEALLSPSDRAFDEGIQYENARLAPLHAALIEIVDTLEDCTHPECINPHTVFYCKCAKCSALKNLERALEQL